MSFNLEKIFEVILEKMAEAGGDGDGILYTKDFDATVKAFEDYMNRSVGPGWISALRVPPITRPGYVDYVFHPEENFVITSDESVQETAVGCEIVVII